ncbi:P-loop containing nucleoside triphosphate hydrolase protein [Chytriomyces sp. MP71]|nr:P-loop containing nucleoside triphosphate hydrolase protein [Chytriomyces sp. MP71]
MKGPPLVSLSLLRCVSLALYGPSARRLSSWPHLLFSATSANSGHTTSAANRNSRGKQRSPSQFTFNTRFPRGDQSVKAGKKNLPQNKRNSQKRSTVSGLALPPSRRLARMGVGVAADVASRPRPRVAATTSSKPSQPKRQKLSPSSSARVNEQRRKQLEAENETRLAQLKYDQKFAIKNTHQRPEDVKQTMDIVRAASFESMNLLPMVVDAVKSVLGESSKPTAVQALAIPASLKLGESPETNRALLVGAETGGGKSIAYLLPMMHRLKQQELGEQSSEEVERIRDVNLESKSIGTSLSGIVEAVVTKVDPDSTQPTTLSSSKLRRLRRPRAIILVPSRDLVNQVSSVAKSLCTHTVRLTVLGTHARNAHPERMAQKLATTPIDILITTPRELNRLLDDKTLALSYLTELVIDESDTLFDESNLPDLESIQHAVQSHSPSTATTTPLTTYVSATFPVSMTSKIAAMHPSHIQIATPKLHRPSSGLKQSFLHATSSATKPQLLLDVLKRSAQAGERRVIVFVNSRDAGTWLADYLRGKRILEPARGGVFVVSGQMETRVRDAVLRLFKEPGATARRLAGDDDVLDSIVQTYSGGEEKQTDGVVKLSWEEKVAVLVATDVASRGVDTTAADHVILYDFPRSSIEYLHRVGRTARNGGKGRATSLLTRRDTRVSDGIESAVKRGTVLG